MKEEKNNTLGVTFLDINITIFIFLCAALLMLGVITTKFSNRLGVPSLVLYILIGMGLTSYIYYDNASITQLVGIFALIIILFKGGIQAKWKHIKPILGPSTSLATFGVLITAVLVGTCAKYILDLTWAEGMLFGAIVGSTDAAAVFAALGNKNIKTKLTSTLEAESGTNDPMAVFLTVSLIELINEPSTSLWALPLDFVLEMGLGLLLGLLFGFLSIKIINNINLDSSGLYPVLALSLAIVTFSGTTLLHGSGFLAVYVMALTVGNNDLTYRLSIVRFTDGFAWMMQILMFILLGLLVFPEHLLAITWQGLVLSFILMIIARPIGVFLSMIGTKYTGKEKLFISWAGLKGAVPIVLATYPLIAGVEGSELLFNAVFFVVFTSALIQGATLSPLANKLNLAGPDQEQSPHILELVSMGKTSSEIIEVVLKEGSKVIGKELKDVYLPSEVLITAIVRGEQVVTPRGETILENHDTLYVLIPKAKRQEVKKMFQ